MNPSNFFSADATKDGRPSSRRPISQPPTSQPPAVHRREGFDDSPPPQSLIQRARISPDALVGEVFERHYESYWHLVTFRMDRRMMSRVDADDILQDAYLAAKQRIHHWVDSPKYSLFAWVRMTLVQTLVDAHRHHLGAEMRCAGREVSVGGPRMPNSTAASLADGLAADSTSPSGAAMRMESQDELRTAIETMSLTDQEIIALRHFEGLTNKQAAEVLELNTTTASNRYVRALTKLQETLDGSAGES